MQAVEPGRVQSAINVTPLVDVVLVLLIIFMVVMPQLPSGPAIQLPTTEQPPEKPDDGKQLLVAMESGGTIWVGEQQIQADRFPETIERAAKKHADWQVVIKGDARLSFGEVKQAMFAIQAAGFKDVGLITEERTTDEEG